MSKKRKGKTMDNTEAADQEFIDKAIGKNISQDWDEEDEEYYASEPCDCGCHTNANFEWAGEARADRADCSYCYRA